jgi:hypothetical protein
VGKTAPAIATEDEAVPCDLDDGTLDEPPGIPGERAR